MLGSTSVAIAIAEEGESAVSISMRRIPVQMNTQPAPNRRPDRKEVMWSPIREPVNASQSYGPIWSPIREPLNISQNYELWSPTPGPIQQDENNEQLWSPTPESEKASDSIFKEVAMSAPVGPEKSVASSDTMIHDKVVPEVTTSSAHAATAPGLNVSKRLSTARGSNVISVEVDSHTQVAAKTTSLKNSAGCASPVDMKTDEKMLIDGGSLHTATEQLRKGKRKPLQEDE